MKNFRLFCFFLGVITATTCVRSDYICFPLQENGITLVLEVNNSNTQRVFLCKEIKNRRDLDSVVRNSTQILVGKDSPSEISISILSTPAEFAQILFIPPEPDHISILPRNAFVLTGLPDSYVLEDPACITLSFPLKERETVRFWHQGVEVVSCASQAFKNIFLLVPEKESPPVYLSQLPRFFTDQRKEDNPQISITPLEGQQGFLYNDTEVICSVPYGDCRDLTFFIDPSLPEYLFYEDNSFGPVNHGHFSVAGNNVSVVRTNMSLVCPGTLIRVYPQTVFYSSKSTE